MRPYLSEFSPQLDEIRTSVQQLPENVRHYAARQVLATFCTVMNEGYQSMPLRPAPTQIDKLPEARKSVEAAKARASEVAYMIGKTVNQMAKSPTVSAEMDMTDTAGELSANLGLGKMHLDFLREQLIF